MPIYAYDDKQLHTMSEGVPTQYWIDGEEKDEEGNLIKVNPYFLMKEACPFKKGIAVDGEWVEVIDPPTPEELKLQGVEFEGVMCSATAEDMWGLSAVEGWVRGGTDTPFRFDNDNVLTLTRLNIDMFYAVWAPFRASFF